MTASFGREGGHFFLLLLQNVRINVARLRSTRVNWSNSDRVIYSMCITLLSQDRREKKPSVRELRERGTAYRMMVALPRRARIIIAQIASFVKGEPARGRLFFAFRVLCRATTGQNMISSVITDEIGRSADTTTLNQHKPHRTASSRVEFGGIPYITFAPICQ